jgi:(p)ppGpp synthase/HD superfamily hydrolase
MSAPSIADTIAFVTEAHRGQPYGGQPYVNHVRWVAERLREHGEHAVLAGLLHDWLEDCDGDVGFLYDQGYPDVVIEAVEAVSLRPGEEYDALIMRAAAHPLGCLVKLCDNAENMSRLDELAETDPERADRLRRKYVPARNTLVRHLGAHAKDHPGMVFGPPVDPAALIAP